MATFAATVKIDAKLFQEFIRWKTRPHEFKKHLLLFRRKLCVKPIELAINSRDELRFYFVRQLIVIGQESLIFFDDLFFLVSSSGTGSSTGAVSSMGVVSSGKSCTSVLSLLKYSVASSGATDRIANSGFVLPNFVAPQLEARIG